MKCAQCIKENKKSNVYPGMSSTTAMYCPPYYDTDGKYHIHDMNVTTQHYSCSNGHNWTESIKHPCPTCKTNW